MAGLLATAAAATPDQAAITDDHATVTWAQLNGRVNQLVHRLRGAGLGVGDRVAVLAGNRREVFEAALACLHGGFTLVPVNWHLTPDEIGYLLADSGARALLVDDERAQAGAAGAAGLPEPLLLHARLDSPDLLAGSPADEPADQCSGNVLLYTSGTSGRPKGAVNPLFSTGAPLEAISRLLEHLGAAMRVPDSGHNALVGPWYHSGQLFFSLFPLLRGCPLRVCGRFDPQGFLDLVERDGITHSHLVPIHFVRLLRLPAAARRRPRSLRVVWHGAAPCPVPVKQAILDWWGPVLLEYYAATEGGVATMVDAHEWLDRPGTVGRALPPTELVVADPDGTVLPAGVDGLVYLRRPAGRGFHYHNAPEQTRRAYLDERTFTYGDVGHLDADGYLYLTGRHTDMVITGGVNVYPAEVENALLTHPWIRDAAVYGEPDDEYGERVVAAVVFEPGAPEDVLSTVDGHCRQTLAGFKVPRRIQVLPELPREPSGKLRKHLLPGLVAAAAR
jgi:long-chain acyl-CoA synthetase